MVFLFWVCQIMYERRKRSSFLQSEKKNHQENKSKYQLNMYTI